MKMRADPPKQPTPSVGEPGSPPEGQTELPDDYAQWLDERTFDQTDGDK